MNTPFKHSEVKLCSLPHTGYTDCTRKQGVGRGTMQNKTIGVPDAKSPASPGKKGVIFTPRL